MRSILLVVCLSFATLCAQNVTVENGGRTIGTRGALNLEPGLGIMEICRDEATANRITCAPSANTAVVSTHDTVHSNENYCVSTNHTTHYSCDLPYKTIEAYKTGMTFVLVADTTCSASCELKIGTLDSVRIVKSDGTTEPAGALVAGEPQWLFYDGRVFRLMGGGSGAPRRLVDESAGDLRARRFIATMATVSYASLVTLETTAGDVHKTTTNNAIGNATIRAATGGLAGQHMWLIIVNDEVSPKTITFGQYLKAAAALTGTPGKAATLQFISDGTVWYEVARSTNL